MSSSVQVPVSFDAQLLIDCDPSYDVTTEALIFGAQLLYLTPALLLHVALLRVLLFTARKEFLENSYYVIFSMDCIVNTLLLLSTLLFDRPVIYLTFLCPPLVSFFSTPSLILQFLFVQPYYLRVAKLSIQIFATLNRMSCVLVPVGYSTVWKKCMPIVIVFVFLSPFTVIWNILVSRPYPIPIYGGFSFGYMRRFEWASLSLLMLIFQLLSLLTTSVSTIVTFSYLIRLSNRLKSAERSLCSASICISICFLLICFFQIYFAFFRGQNFKTLYALQYLAFDLLIIGTPLVLLFHSRPLRSKLSIFESSVAAQNSTPSTTNNRNV